jgi:hypothetical protein
MALASAATIIKPDDLVRVRSTGRTAKVLELLTGRALCSSAHWHRRRLEDVVTKARSSRTWMISISSSPRCRGAGLRTSPA